MTARRALPLAVASCLFVSACDFQAGVHRAEQGLLGLVLLAFGVPATALSLVGVTAAVVRGVKRSPRRLLNVWLAAFFAFCMVIVHVQVVRGLDRRPKTIFCLVLSSTPLLWLVAAVTEAALAPTSPPGEDELAMDRSVGRWLVTFVPSVLALVLYGLILDHALGPDLL